MNRIHTVGIIAFDKDHVLLVEHGRAAQHLTGVWGLPGGRLEDGEELLDAAAREFEEETGLTPQKDSMLQLPTIYEAEIPRKNGETLSTYWNVFVVKKYEGELLGSDETKPHWIPVGDISKHNLLPNSDKAISEALQLIHS